MLYLYPPVLPPIPPEVDSAGTNAELEVLEKTPLLEWFAEEYKKFGCTLEFVTNRSQEGSQFCRGFGGILIVTTHDSCRCRKMGPRASTTALFKQLFPAGQELWLLQLSIIRGVIKISFGMAATSKTDNGENKSQLRVSNLTRTTMKREKLREPDAWDMFVEFCPLFNVERKRLWRSVDVDGVGKVGISFESGKVLILSNVLYVPKINLLSVEKLYKIGYTFYYEGKEVAILEGWHCVGKGYDTCGLYRLS
ncbi:peptide chain release factor subunit [Tanacetum coccineum]